MRGADREVYYRAELLGLRERGLHCTLGFNLGMLCITKVTLPQYQAARCTVSHFIRDTPVVWYSDPCTLYSKIQQSFRLGKTRFVGALKRPAYTQPVAVLRSQGYYITRVKRVF